MTAKNLTVTTALPPRGREEAVLRVAAKYEPSLLLIVAGIPMPDFGRPLALHMYLLRRDRTLERLDAAAALARTWSARKRGSRLTSSGAAFPATLRAGRTRPR